ncbi:MAG: transporter permease, partial [Microbacterium sp.]|nr:transporter permease [Microbacterium sp.]
MTLTAPPAEQQAPPSGSTPAALPKRSWRHRISRFDQNASPYFYISPFFLLFGLVGLFPLLYTVWVAVHEWDLLKGEGDFVGVGNFVEI